MLHDLSVREQIENRLADRKSPILNDGTPLRELIDFDNREVAMRVLFDQEIHRLELKRVFGRSWTVLGHATEIPDSGDYVVRYLAEDQVIVSRSRDGAISVMLNACSHRGMPVCWTDRGNSSRFRCPYHGWIFNSDGSLVGAPFQEEMYGQMDKSRRGLRTARVELRHGIIFATFNRQAPPLDEYLGDIGWYFDQMFGSTEMEALGVPSRSRVNANWKIASDNNSGDGYHTPTLHRSIAELGFLPDTEAYDAKVWSLEGCYDVSSPQGHGLRCVEVAGAAFKQETAGAKGPFDGWFLAGNLFPGNGVHSTPFPAPDNSKVLQTADISVTIPKGPGAFEVWRLPLIEKGLAESERDQMAKKFLVQVAVAQTDDFVGWQELQKAAQGCVGSEQTLKYDALLEVNKPEAWPGPGLVYAGFSKDDNQWHFWLRWYDMMTS